MISLYQLKNKLNKQAKEFAELLEFPDLYAQGLWARGVYNSLTFLILIIVSKRHLNRKNWIQF